MKISKLVTLMSAAGMACMVSLPAMAQTTSSGTIAPVTSTSSKAEKHKHEHKKHEHDEEKHKKDQKVDASQQNAVQDKEKDKDKKQHEDKKSSALPANEQFSSLGEATAHCGAGNVEWATLGGSKIYHGSSSHYFGHTKHGVYACKAELDAAGFHAGR